MSAMTTHFSLRLLPFLLLLLPVLSNAQPQQVIYSWPMSMLGDARGSYPIALLHLAIEKSGTEYQLVPNGQVMSQHRTLRQLGSNSGLDVVWTMTSTEREKELRPIRIPIDRGLIGWRLLLIHNDNEQKIQQLDEKQLKTSPSIQGSDWPDYPILKANQFRVLGSGDFEAMFKMLQAKRIDYFPRSVTEIWPELQQRSAMSLIVAPKWVLHYPAALYFFVQKDNIELANAIEIGLLRAIEDGSMQQLFLQHFSSALQQAELKSRTVIQLTNPVLPAETPLQNKALWFDPQLGY
ncbi:MAG: transporter substrate-binding domain-containing protein [Gammaproteobacteria bacterium]|nr:transporter substrate-binding domain-containing protein [Gammaproteobacteria bacterium]MBU2059357.1 transporter substrate-binding domain-containing protein [Gammaproteobacteria bacterium]MBU2175263.1 transporter substrate-binding domain-containing protein [Gammaproteobacteria bacterium]MBU2247471.1 transporter substrate-binding domain-containing protein [Gammaproteobacteria bacterium]MBU2346262.1 transporter substrate-binding domain-containing protein [Gammaproteobacteria bacterium]